jgi:hypothetical protein
VRYFLTYQKILLIYRRLNDVRRFLKPELLLAGVSRLVANWTASASLELTTEKKK